MEIIKPMLPMLVGQLQKVIQDHQTSLGGSLRYSLAVMNEQLTLTFWHKKDGQVSVIDQWDSQRLLSEFNIGKIIETALQGDSGPMGLALKMALNAFPNLTIDNTMVGEVMNHLANFLLEVGRQEQGKVFVELALVSKDRKKILGISRGEKSELEMTIVVISGAGRRVLDSMPAAQFIGVLLDRAAKIQPLPTQETKVVAIDPKTDQAA